MQPNTFILIVFNIQWVISADQLDKKKHRVISVTTYLLFERLDLFSLPNPKYIPHQRNGNPNPNKYFPRSRQLDFTSFHNICGQSTFSCSQANCFSTNCLSYLPPIYVHIGGLPKRIYKKLWKKSSIIRSQTPKSKAHKERSIHSSQNHTH